MRPTRLGIIGLGAIGGSLGRQAKRAGIPTVLGWSPEPAERVRAVQEGALDDAPARPEDVVARVELLILAAPPAANLALLDRLHGRLATGAIMTDTGSVKRGIVTRAENAVHDIRSRNSAHHLKESPGSLVRLCWREVPDDRGVAKDTDSSPCLVVRDRVGPDSIETHERNHAVLRIPRFRKAARAEAVPGLVDGSFAVPHGDVDAVQVDMTGEEVVPEERDVRNEIVDRPDLRGLRREEQSRRGE